jgi:heme exporter protein B
MAWRQAFSWLTPLLFFIIVVCIFPLALGPDNELLQNMAPGIIWIAALLATVISIGNLFRNDADVGHLDTLLLSPHSLTLIVICKIFSHWLMYGLPLIFVSPLLGFLLHLSAKEEYALVLTLLLGTPVLSLIGGMGAALIVGIRNHGLLLPILIMPFYIPVLIFGTGTIQIAATHQPVIAYYAIMAAILLITLAFAPLFTGMALKIGVNQ